MALAAAVGLPACRGLQSAAAPDVAALLQSRRLQLGKSREQRVVQALGVPTTREKEFLHGRMRNGGDLTNRWETFDYPQLGVECVMVESSRKPYLYKITLKPPYAQAVLDTVFLGRQTLGQLARALNQPLSVTTQGRGFGRFEVRASVRVDDVRLETRARLDSATWSRCQRRPALLDSLIGARPINQVDFVDKP